MSTRLYAESHEWLELNGDIATIGISDFAQAELGDITYIDLPQVGASVSVGKEFGSVESVKAASDIYSPVNGEVIEVNDELDAKPELLNSSPYAEGWIIKVKISEPATGLLTEEEYKAKCAG